jgi:hypothetical protein
LATTFSNSELGLKRLDTLEFFNFIPFRFRSALSSRAGELFDSSRRLSSGRLVSRAGDPDVVHAILHAENLNLEVSIIRRLTLLEVLRS